LNAIQQSGDVPQLLVSIRDKMEVDAIESLPPHVRALIRVVDLKEPKRGSLGPASIDTTREVLKSVAEGAILSAALGELGDLEDRGFQLELPEGFQFAKIGLAGALDDPNWKENWRRVAGSLPSGTGSVAVCYLDHQTCNAPAPGDIIELAEDAGCGGVLLDTYDKSSGGFFDHIGSRDLSLLLQKIRQKKMFSVLAGSINSETLALAISFSPSMIGVRGAVCESDRNGRMTEKKLNQFCKLFELTVTQKGNFSRSNEGEIHV
jgi:uncharacterized protein (UPF0264 family)